MSISFPHQYHGGRVGQDIFYLALPSITLSLKNLQLQGNFIPELTPLQKARLAPRAPRPSMRKAINDKCKECIYDPIAGGGTWRQQVESCISANCALHPLRPTAKSADISED